MIKSNKNVVIGKMNYLKKPLWIIVTGWSVEEQFLNHFINYFLEYLVLVLKLWHTIQNFHYFSLKHIAKRFLLYCIVRQEIPAQPWI